MEQQRRRTLRQLRNALGERPHRDAFGVPACGLHGIRREVATAPAGEDPVVRRGAAGDRTGHPGVGHADDPARQVPPVLALQERAVDYLSSGRELAELLPPVEDAVAAVKKEIELSESEMAVV